MPSARKGQSAASALIRLQYNPARGERRPPPGKGTRPSGCDLGGGLGLTGKRGYHPFAVLAP